MSTPKHMAARSHSLASGAWHKIVEPADDLRGKVHAAACGLVFSAGSCRITLSEIDCKRCIAAMQHETRKANERRRHEKSQHMRRYEARRVVRVVDGGDKGAA